MTLNAPAATRIEITSKIRHQYCCDPSSHVWRNPSDTLLTLLGTRKSCRVSKSNKTDSGSYEVVILKNFYEIIATHVKSRSMKLFKLLILCGSICAITQAAIARECHDVVVTPQPLTSTRHVSLVCSPFRGRLFIDYGEAEFRPEFYSILEQVRRHGSGRMPRRTLRGPITLSDRLPLFRTNNMIGDQTPVNFAIRQSRDNSAQKPTPENSTVSDQSGVKNLENSPAGEPIKSPNHPGGLNGRTPAH